MIKNIVFDMGKVLLQYDPHAVCRQYCQSPEEEAVVFRELFEGPEWVLMDKGEMTPDESLEQIKQRVPEKFHKALTECLQNWTICMIPVPGAKDFVKEVRNAGYDLYVLSNAAPAFYDYFPKEYPLEIFDDVVVSCDVHKVKPDPAIYLHLLRTNELRSQECLFIDDSPANVETAKDLGMKAMVFDGDWRKIREELGEGTSEDETIGSSLRRRLSGRRIRIALAVLIVILLASTLPLAVFYTSDGYRYDKCIRQGIAYMKAGRYDEALGEYSRAIDIDDTQSRPWILRGDVFALMGDNARAVRDYKVAIELGADDEAIQEKIDSLTAAESRTESTSPDSKPEEEVTNQTVLEVAESEDSLAEYEVTAGVKDMIGYTLYPWDRAVHIRVQTPEMTEPVDETFSQGFGRNASCRLFAVDLNTKDSYRNLVAVYESEAGTMTTLFAYRQGEIHEIPFTEGSSGSSFVFGEVPGDGSMYILQSMQLRLPGSATPVQKRKFTVSQLQILLEDPDDQNAGECQVGHIENKDGKTFYKQGITAKLTKSCLVSVDKECTDTTLTLHAGTEVVIDGLYRIPGSAPGMIDDADRDYYTWTNEYGEYEGYYDPYGNFMVGYWGWEGDFVEYGYFDADENYHDIAEYPYPLSDTGTAADDGTDGPFIDADGAFSYHIKSGDYDGWVEAQYMDQAFGMAAADTWENQE